MRRKKFIDAGDFSIPLRGKVGLALDGTGVGLKHGGLVGETVGLKERGTDGVTEGVNKELKEKTPL